MNEWALLKGGRIVNVVMTSRVLSEVQRMYPDYEVANLYSLPAPVQQAYPYWNERP
jgi:hypothetical protein